VAITVTITEKTCTGCGETKPLEAFSRHNKLRDGRHTRCMVCRREEPRVVYKDWTPEQRQKHRERVMLCRYGLTMDVLNDLYESQEGCCAICGTWGERPVPTDEVARKRATLCVDHDHDTGRVRGLLCRNCNSALGKLGDSVDRLVKAAAYLVENGGQ
jgi:Autographiviridae endonuclease VII